MIELQRPRAPGADHDRAEFDCGEPSLDQWLRRYSGQNRRDDTAATWVIATPTNRVMAYATLSITAIDQSAAPVKLGKSAPDPVPALLVGRLAVDRAVAGLGVGTALVRHLLATAVELNVSAACRAVVVTALHDSAAAWWERFGFVRFDSDGLDLYLLTKDIVQTLTADDR